MEYTITITDAEQVTLQRELDAINAERALNSLAALDPEVILQGAISTWIATKAEQHILQNTRNYQVALTMMNAVDKDAVQAIITPYLNAPEG